MAKDEQELRSHRRPGPAPEEAGKETPDASRRPGKPAPKETEKPRRPGVPKL